MYLCFIEDPDGSIIHDSFMVFSTEIEAEFWKKIIHHTYRDDKPQVKEIEVEPKMWEKHK